MERIFQEILNIERNLDKVFNLCIRETILNHPELIKIGITLHESMRNWGWIIDQAFIEINEIPDVLSTIRQNLLITCTFYNNVQEGLLKPVEEERYSDLKQITEILKRWYNVIMEFSKYHEENAC